MIFDKTGSLATTKRHDYLPFGEELFAGQGGRTTALGYTGRDGVRQQFTSKERDNETGLDYFLARYYSSIQGRFTSVDPEQAGAREDDPQSLNGYAYARSNPVRFVDLDGRWYEVCDNAGNCREHTDKEWKPLFDPKNASSAGVVLQGDRNSGKIFNEQGEQIGTYKFTGHDYWSPFQQGVVNKLRDPKTWRDALPGAIINTVTRGAGRNRSSNTPGLPPSAPKPLGRGSTGRAAPRNLKEQLALETAMSNPAAGRIVRMAQPMRDTRWPASDGWVKMRMNVNEIEIHYVRNTRTGDVDDFKIMNK